MVIYFLINGTKCVVLLFVTKMSPFVEQVLSVTGLFCVFLFILIMSYARYKGLIGSWWLKCLYSWNGGKHWFHCPIMKWRKISDTDILYQGYRELSFIVSLNCVILLHQPVYYTLKRGRDRIYLEDEPKNQVEEGCKRKLNTIFGSIVGKVTTTCNYVYRIIEMVERQVLSLLQHEDQQAYNPCFPSLVCSRFI